MKGDRPNWRVSVVVETADKKGRWTDVGIGYNNPKSRTITLLSDTWPYKLVLNEWKPKEEVKKPEPKQLNVFGGG